MFSSYNIPGFSLTALFLSHKFRICKQRPHHRSAQFHIAFKRGQRAALLRGMRIFAEQAETVQRGKAFHRGKSHDGN